MPQRDPLSEAFEHYNAGRTEEAARACKAILARDPDQPETNHLLGVMWFRQGKAAEARELLKRATASPGATAEMHNNYGAVLNALGELEPAAEAFRKALALQPDYPWALNNLGVVYRDTKQPAAAIEAFRRATALKPDFAEAAANLRSAYRDLIPAWHFAMMNDAHRNDVYEAAIARASPGKRVLEIGTGAGLLAMMASKAGAKAVTTCESVGVIADRARVIVARNGFSGRVMVIGKRSTELVIGRDLPERAEVLITETFSSNLLDEGILPTIEHAHAHLLTPDATIIPAAASAMGFLIGGEALIETLFVGRVKGFDLGPFNDFAPPVLAVGLDGMAHDVLSEDVELFRFNLKDRQFPMTRQPLSLTATRRGLCAGIAQWIKVELDSDTIYGNRPEAHGVHAHWSHLVYRFPKPVAVEPGTVIGIVARHDRTQINIDFGG